MVEAVDLHGGPLEWVMAVFPACKPSVPEIKGEKRGIWSGEDPHKGAA